MVIDGIHSIPAPQAADIVIENSTEVAVNKPIEETGKSTNIDLDIEKDNVTRQQSMERVKRQEKDVGMYKSNGDLVQNNQNGENEEGETSILDVTV
jgi:hypothetical protein